MSRLKNIGVGFLVFAVGGSIVMAMSFHVVKLILLGGVVIITAYGIGALVRGDI